MEIKFSKMHGLGNDFMVIDAINQHIRLTQKHIRYMADRHIGIGFDQCLVLEPSNTPDIDFNYRIFNADGNEVGQCGNGARCLAKFIYDKKLSDKPQILVATLKRILELSINPDTSITVNLGIPNFEPKAIPLMNHSQQALYTIAYESHPLEFYALTLGNPHAVMIVTDLENAPVDAVGRFLNQHPDFPNGVNVGFMQIIDKYSLKLRVFERGVGETIACGSGACAAMICGRQFHYMAEKILVDLPGGRLYVEWSDAGKPVFLTGTAHTVYEGVITL